MVEIRREGWKARRVFRVRPPPPLHRYFAKTVVRRGMSRGEEEREEEARSADSTIRAGWEAVWRARLAMLRRRDSQGSTSEGASAQGERADTIRWGAK
jgi:hypothetical protein